MKSQASKHISLTCLLAIYHYLPISNFYLNRDNIQEKISAAQRNFNSTHSQEKNATNPNSNVKQITLSEAFNQTHGMQDTTLLNYDTNSIRKRRLDTKLTTQIVPENQIMSRVDSWAKIEDLRVLVA